MAAEILHDSLQILEQTTPGTPSAGYIEFYGKSDHKLYIKDSTGTETQVGAGAGGSSKSFSFFAG